MSSAWNWCTDPDCTKALFESALLRVFDMLVNCNNLCFECFVCPKLQCKIWRHHNSLHLAASAVWSSNSLLCMHFSDLPFVSVIDDFVSEGFYHIPHDDFHAWHTLKSVLQCQWPRPRFLAVHICIRMVAPFVQPCWVPNAPIGITLFGQLVGMLMTVSLFQNRRWLLKA